MKLHTDQLNEHATVILNIPSIGTNKEDTSTETISGLLYTFYLVPSLR